MEQNRGRDTKILKWGGGGGGGRRGQGGGALKGGGGDPPYKLCHNVGFIDSFQFCVSLISLYSYL